MNCAGKRNQVQENELCWSAKPSTGESIVLLRRDQVPSTDPQTKDSFKSRLRLSVM